MDSLSVKEAMSLVKDLVPYSTINDFSCQELDNYAGYSRPYILSSSSGISYSASGAGTITYGGISTPPDTSKLYTFNCSMKFPLSAIENNQLLPMMQHVYQLFDPRVREFIHFRQVNVPITEGICSAQLTFSFNEKQIETIRNIAYTLKFNKDLEDHLTKQVE